MLVCQSLWFACLWQIDEQSLHSETSFLFSQMIRTRIGAEITWTTGLAQSLEEILMWKVYPATRHLSGVSWGPLTQDAGRCWFEDAFIGDGEM